ncbi:MAG: sulfatase-like hydrolase/transferase [Bacteroidales bacterium]|nr:sulfatase-like hydrolase/transferase [Bacteroidales bacterium]
MLQEKIQQSTNRFVSILLWTTLFLLCVRIYETVILSISSNVAVGTLIQLNCEGLLNDVVYLGKLSVILFPLFLLLSYYREKLANNLLRIILVLYLLISCCLVSFFSIVGVPLDRIVFLYSFQDIIEIVSSSQTADWWEYILLICLLFSFWILSKKQIIERFAVNGAILVLYLACVFFPNASFGRASSQEAYNITENKLAFFIKSVCNATISSSIEECSLQEQENMFHNAFPNYVFSNDSYPFLYKDSTVDVLTPYFSLKPKKPNFVFIIVEGLGREFSGYNSIVPSATPFLDSLSQVGLSWNNCFSTSQRTICALPSIFGSLPFGKSGFMNYKEYAPSFNSLLTILHDNNYHSTFSYGGWLCFDDMCHFLKLNEIDDIVDVSLYDTTTQKNTWGLYDDFLFKQTMQTIDFSKESRVDVYLTLTTHDPFEYPDEEKYVAQYSEILNSKSDCPYIAEGNVRKIASYLYLDNSLRELFKLYEEKPNFDNTIFVITGDHDFNMQQDPVVLNNVPFIIWSPMLAQSKRFPAVVSHRDITPSILAMLKKNYFIDSPENVAWLNSGLDTSSHFQSKTFNPIMDLGRSLSHCIYNDFFVWNNQPYFIQYKNDRLQLQPYTDSCDVLDFFNTYKMLDMYVMENNALIENWNHDNQDKLHPIFSVKSKQEQLSFYQKRIPFAPCDFKGVKEAYFLHDIDFPCDLYTYEFKGNELDFQLEVRFKNYIPLCSDSTSTIAIVTEINRGEEKVYWSADFLNGPSFHSYDSWTEFKTKYDLRKAIYDYRPGDKIKFYIWNSTKRDFYLADIQLSAAVISQKE